MVDNFSIQLAYTCMNLSVSSQPATAPPPHAFSSPIKVPGQEKKNSKAMKTCSFSKMWGVKFLLQIPTNYPGFSGRKYHASSWEKTHIPPSPSITDPPLHAGAEEFDSMVNFKPMEVWNSHKTSGFFRLFRVGPFEITKNGWNFGQKKHQGNRKTMTFETWFNHHIITCILLTKPRSTQPEHCFGGRLSTQIPKPISEGSGGLPNFVAGFSS